MWRNIRMLTACSAIVVAGLWSSPSDACWRTHGCWSSCYSGCYGGCYSSCGFGYGGGCGGYYGGYGGGYYGSGGPNWGWYGSSGYYPAGTYAGSFYSPLAASAPRKNDPSAGRLLVSVPKDAKVYVNDQLTTSTGAQREYQSPGLQPSTSYKFVVRVETVRDGQTVSETKSTQLQGGQSASLAFSGEAAAAPWRSKLPHRRPTWSSKCRPMLSCTWAATRQPAPEPFASSPPRRSPMAVSGPTTSSGRPSSATENCSNSRGSSR